MMNNKGKLHTFSIDHESEDSGQSYNGTFTSKKLSILDQTKISRRKSELCGGMYCVRDDDGNPTGRGIDEGTEFLNQMIGILEVAVVSHPVWWDLSELADEELLSKVFGEVMQFENSFRRPRGSKTGDNVGSGRSEGDSQEQHSKAVATDNAPKVVDGQVQASLDA
jgi:hypothetical protein